MIHAVAAPLFGMAYRYLGKVRPSQVYEKRRVILERIPEDKYVEHKGWGNRYLGEVDGVHHQLWLQTNQTINSIMGLYKLVDYNNGDFLGVNFEKMKPDDLQRLFKGLDKVEQKLRRVIFSFMNKFPNDEKLKR